MNPIVVQKYGGSSLADLDRVRAVAARIVETVRSGKRVVAVVSAMGGTTDELLARAKGISENPNTRAVMFHLGKYIPTGVPDTYGFNGLDNSQTTGDTVALKYSNGMPGLDSVVKFRWNGSGVELIGNTG